MGGPALPPKEANLFKLIVVCRLFRTALNVRELEFFASQEANLYKLIAKSYETKEYKSGLKASDQILLKYPDHGETLAMKGLTLSCIDKKPEAYELVRKGLKNDLKSHVCWHICGLLYRSDRDYREAISCYQIALRIDPENIQILEDLSLLQAQVPEILTLKPSHRINWIGFSIAQHLNQEPEMIVNMSNAYEGTLEEDLLSESERHEQSELVLFKHENQDSLLEEAGNLDMALEELPKHEGKIEDKLALKEQQASLHLQMNRLAEAEDIYRELLDYNPENYLYYEGVQKGLGLLPDGKVYTSEQVEKLVEVYSNLREKYPRSAAAKRIPLDFLKEGAFEAAVSVYVRPFLREGVSSLYSELRSLYSHPRKVEMLEDTFLEIKSSLETSKTFPSSSEIESPSTYLWTLYLLAQHFDDRRQYEKALSLIDQAIAHTPTVTDLYPMKERIIEHAGHPEAAAALADEACSMDLRTTPVTATIIATPPQSASPLRLIKTSSPATTSIAPPRTASPTRQMRKSTTAASVTAPPRTASPARQTRTPSAAPSATAPPRTASPPRQTKVSPSGNASPRTASPARQTKASTSANAPPRSSSPSRQIKTPISTPVSAPPRTASPCRQARTSSTSTAGTPALRPASPVVKVAKTPGPVSQNGPAGVKVLRGLSPGRARSSAVDSRVPSSPRAGTGLKSSGVVVPFPPASVKSARPALTSLKVSPRPSPVSSPRAENPQASGVIVPFPLTAVKSLTKPSITSVKPSPRPASPSVKPAPRSASPSVKASARPASPSVKPSPRPASPSVKTPARPASPSVKTPARPALSSVKSTPRAASPSARATTGTSPRTDVVNVASRPASPSRKPLGAPPSQALPASPRATEKKSANGVSAPSRASSLNGKLSSSSNSAVTCVTPATSARSMPSSSSSSQTLLKSKIASVAPPTRRGVQLSSCESPQNLSSGRSDSSSDVPPDSASPSTKSVVQEVPIQRLRIASFKRNSSGLSTKATEIVSPEVLSAPAMQLNTKKRCGWVTSQSDDIHIAYHDNEWGVPVYDDKLLFELIVLQGAQAELSWPTILARRNNFRAVFANFDPAIVAKFDEKKKLSLIADSSICFPEAKVRGAVDNAAHVLKIIEEYGSLSKFLWSYVNHKSIVSQYKLAKQVPVKTPKSEALSKELLRRGFRFVGPTTMYSVMQAAGMFCDHLVTCYKYQESSAENSPVDLEEEETDSWQRISLPEWRAASPRGGAVQDTYPHEFRKPSANALDPVWAELPIIEEREDEMEANSDNDDEEYDGLSPC